MELLRKLFVAETQSPKVRAAAIGLVSLIVSVAVQVLTNVA